MGIYQKNQTVYHLVNSTIIALLKNHYFNIFLYDAASFRVQQATHHHMDFRL